MATLAILKAFLGMVTREQALFPAKRVRREHAPCLSPFARLLAASPNGELASRLCGSMVAQVQREILHTNKVEIQPRYNM